MSKPTYRELEKRVQELEKILNEPVTKQILNVYSQNPIPTLILHGDGKIIGYNDAMVRLTEYTCEEIPDIKAWISRIDPDGNLRNKVIGTSGKFTNKEKDIAKNEFIITRKDGEKRQVEFYMHTLLPEGNKSDLRVVQGVDNTERRIEEKRSSRQREFLNTVIESLSHPFYVLNTEDYRITLANSAAAPADIPKTTTCFSLTHKRSKPCGGKEHICPLEEVKKTKKHMVIEHLHCDIDGNIKNVEIHAHPIFDSKGNVVQMIEYTLDITERKKAEVALKRGKASLAEAQRISHLGNWDWDIKSHKLHWSNEIYRIFGFNMGDFKGTYEAFLECVHPEDREFVEKKVNEALYEKKPYCIDHRILLYDGTERIVHERAEVMHDKAGKPIRMVGTVHDITGRKKIENELMKERNLLRTLIDNLPDSIYVKDAESRFVIANIGIAEDIGTTTDELIGKTDFNFFPREIAERFYADEQEVVYSGQAIVQKEEKTINTAGNYIYFLTTKVPLTDTDGKVVGIVGIGHNITKRKQTEEQIRKSLREKEMLLQEIHHRVKNNMQVISSLLNLQSRYIKDKQMLEMLKDNQNRIKAMSLIHEKLYQSRDLTNIDFKKYIKTLTGALFRSYRVRSGRINLKIDVEGVLLGVEPAIPCGLIINELITNALKHAFPEGREGEIKVMIRSIGKDKIELAVSDDGIGMPKDLDLTSPTTLGLQLIKMLAEDQLHGKIKLDRSQGTKIQIRFRVIGNE